MNRTTKALYNIGTAMTGNMIVILLRFVNRIILIRTLGAAYLGLSGLFNSIFSILDLAELGIGGAITFALYKPLADQDIEKIKSLMKLYKKAYITIGVGILAAGFLIYPFIPFIIKDRSDIVNTDLIYFMYLSQTVISYCFFSYKTAIITADQKEYKLNILNSLTSILVVLMQGVILITTHNYILYLGISIVSGILKNYVGARMAEKQYPYILDKEYTPLSKAETKGIFDNIKGLAMYKISSKVLSSTDNIIVSAFIGISMVGKFDNYNYFWMIATGICMILFNSYTPSIGNLYVTESRDKLEEFFDNLNFANFWIYGIVSVGLYELMTPIVTLFFGSDFALSNVIVWMIVLNFVTSGLQNAVITYKDACGLFYKGRWRPVFSALFNIVISLILVRPYGIAGVVAGTIISRFLTTWWFDAWLVFYNVFEKSPIQYYMRYLYHLCCVVVACLVNHVLCLWFAGMYPLLSIFIRGCVSVVTANILFYLTNFWLGDFHRSTRIIQNLMGKFLKKFRKAAGKIH